MSDWITVTIADVKGSAPRAAGTSMRVFASHQTGTIGGGALEWEASRIAREMLRNATQQARHNIPLGPDLGQCCGGAVVLDFTANLPEAAPPPWPIWIWGAGHVGRALIPVLAPLPGAQITWVDTTPERFPDPMPDGPAPLIAADPPRALRHAPETASHVIVTYSHDIDLALCNALLQRDFHFAGLIGSATKWARFRTRLAALGHAPARIARITCPIGDPTLGKHPAQLAVGVAAQLLNQERPCAPQKTDSA